MPADGMNTSKASAVATLSPASAVALMNHPDRPSSALPASAVASASKAPPTSVRRTPRASSIWRNTVRSEVVVRRRRAIRPPPCRGR